MHDATIELQDAPVVTASWRRAALVIGLVSAALVAVGAQTRRMVIAEQAALVARFSDEQERQVAEVAKALTEDLTDIREDLQFTARLLSTAVLDEERGRELRALLAAVAQYRLASVYDDRGARLLQIDDPRTGDALDPEPLEASMREAALAALATPGELQVSPSLPVASMSWFRVFSVSVPGGPRTLAGLSVLVDTETFFKRALPLVSSTGSRLLLIGREGQALPGTDPTLVAHLNDQGALARASGGQELVQRMARGERGRVRLHARDAQALGLDAEDLIATFAPISGVGTKAWSIAKLASTAPLREHEQRTLIRIGVAALAIAACLIALGAYFFVATRGALLVREQLRRAQLVAHMHEQTQSILDHMPSAVLALSEARRVTALNRAMHRRASRAALGGSLLETLPDAEPADLARVSVLVERVMRGGGVSSLLAERLKLFGKEGNYSIHAISLGAQRPDTRVIVVIEDLTEVTSLTTQLLHAEKLATVGILAAGIAHEIGTPIGVMRGRAEYLLDKLAVAGRDARDAAVIVEQADLVTRIIRQLLDFSRRKTTDIQAVSVASVAGTAVELLRFEAERRRLVLAAEVSESLPKVAADRDQLQQVLVNLLMNACDASQAGGRVTLSADVERSTAPALAESVLIEVADDGCGIPEQNRHQVFDPFFTTKKRGRGTGLGLTIAAQIVRDHRGQIELASDLRKGTRVIIRWPTAQPSASTEASVALIG